MDLEGHKIAINLEEKNKIELVKPNQQEYKYIGSFRIIPGLKLWEYNLQTEELKLAELNKTSIAKLDGSALENKKCERHNNCIYFQALNFTNAEKKAAKIKKYYNSIIQK